MERHILTSIHMALPLFLGFWVAETIKMEIEFSVESKVIGHDPSPCIQTLVWQDSSVHVVKPDPEGLKFSNNSK